MTTILQQLRDERTARLEAEAKDQAVCRERERTQALADFRADIEVKRLPVALLDELKAEFAYDISARRPILTLHYQDETSPLLYSKDITVGAVVDWTSKVDAQIQARERKRAAKRAEFANTIPEITSLRALRATRNAVESYRFTDADDLTQALNAREAELQAAYDAEIAQVVAQVEAATDDDTLDDAEWNYPNEPRVLEVTQAARQRLHQIAVEHQQHRAQAEQAEFWPFRVWRLHYAIVASDDDTQVETDTTYVTTPEPDESGCFLNPYGVALHIYHPVYAQMVDVHTFEDMERVDCYHRVSTPDGWIHVPPTCCQGL